MVRGMEVALTVDRASVVVTDRLVVRDLYSNLNEPLS